MTPSEQNGTTCPSPSANSARAAGKAGSAGKKAVQPEKRPAPGKTVPTAGGKVAGTSKEAPGAGLAVPAPGETTTEPLREGRHGSTEAPPAGAQEPPAGTETPAPDEKAPAVGAQEPPAGTEATGAGTTAPAPREEAAPSAGTTRPRPGWRDLLRPRASATHLLVAVLCAALGFGVVTQIRQTHDDALAGMRQDDLVRLLDELTRRNGELGQEQEQLRSDLADLRSSTSSREAAAKAAAEQARVQGVLAGTLPVQGPGVRVTIQDPAGEVRAQTLVKILEELRNAGAEAVELSGQRLTASSWILDNPDGGLVVDGTTVRPPYEWTAIGDSHTISVALDIPGGALASVRNAGGRAQMTESDDLEITTVRELEAPKYATPAPSKDDQ